MSRKTGKPKSRVPGGSGAAVPRQTGTYRAGCGREWQIKGFQAPDLAYLELAHPECSTCVHRVEPEGAAPFCTLRPAQTAHPFASLGQLKLD